MIYVASRASIPERSAMWRQFRSEGYPIISTWIDEAGPGETENLTDLWERIDWEIRRSYVLIFYAEPGDLPLKGALIEVGMALGKGKRIIVCLPGIALDLATYRPIGSWIKHPLVLHENVIHNAFEKAMELFV